MKFTKRFYAQIGVLLIAGALFAWGMAARADREMRAGLLQQARLVAHAVNLNHVKALTGTPADLDNPSYLQLKEQLSQVKQACGKCRFVYLLGRQADGRLFIYVDNEPAGSHAYSPPGQVYDEAPEEFRRVFGTRTGITAGPVTDRWGTWVSALVPLTGPATGAMAAALGMDIDARAWKWDVAAQAAPPVGLMLVLLIGVSAFFAASPRAGASPKPVLRRLLPPLAAILILLMAGAGALLWHQQRQRLSEEIAAQIASVSRELRIDLENHADGLVAAARPIAAHATVRKALAQGHADGLLRVWRSVFETLRRQNHLTHFYFHDARRVCLLRVHDPQKRGDRIEHFAAREAERTRQTASGIELGPLGTFTLRVVQPVYEGGRLAGYVELGKEIEEVLQARRDRAGLELAVVIPKERLNRQSWEAGMRLLGREAHWDRLPHSALIYTSQVRLADAFTPWAGRVAGERAYLETDREIDSDGKHWRVSAIPLRDVRGKEFGGLLVMRDITAEKAAFARLLGMAGTAGGVLLTLLLAVVYVLLRRTDAGLRAQQVQLRHSEEHLFATLRSIGDGVIACDGQGMVDSLNAVAETLTGWSTGEARGRPIAEVFRIIDASTRREAEIPVGRVLREDRIVGLTNHTALLARDGAERQIADSCAPIHDAAGVVVGAVLVFRDVTEENGRRDQLRESEARFHQLAAHSGVIVWEVDAQGLYTYVSQVAETVWGYRPDELVGRMHFYDLHPESGRQAFQEAAFAVSERKEAFLCLINAVRTKDGRQVWVSSDGFPLLNADGTLRGYRGSDTDITEHRRAEEALKESEEKNRLLFEHSVSAIAVHEIVLDAAGRPVDYIFLSANPAFEIQTGLPVAGILGRRATEVLPGIRKTSFIEIFGQVALTGEAVSFEQYFEPLARHFIINAYKVGEGRFAATFTDITGRKRAAEALRDSQERYRQIVETAREGIWVIDLEGKVSYANQRIAEMLEYPPGEVVGRPVADFMAPEHHERSRQNLARRRQGIQEQYEFTFLRRTGSPLHALVSTNPLYDQAGRYAGALGMLTDITEHKRAEEALRSGEARLRGITDSAQDAILMMDPRGLISYWNPAAESILGYSSQEAIGETVHKLLVPERYLAAHLSALPEFIRSGRGKMVGKTVELVARRKDGREIAVDLSLSAICLEGEWHAVGILRDITERKQAGERIEQTLLRQRGVSRLQQSLLAPAPLTDKLRMVTDAIVRLFDADFCRIWLIQPGDLCEAGCQHAGVGEGPHVCRHRDRCLHLLASSGRYTHIDGPGHRRVPFGCYKIGRLASGEDSKFTTNDAQNDPRVHNHAWARELGLVSFAGYQLRTKGGEPLGVLALFAKHPILADEDALLEGLGSTTALVIKQAAAEEALRQSEERFRQIVTHAGEGITYVDAEERFQSTNPAAETIFGVPPNGLVGRSLAEFLRPEEFSRILKQSAGRLGGTESCYELEIMRPDGATRQIQVTAVPNVSGEGQFKGTFEVIHDITERKRMEEALQAKEHLLSESQAVAHIGSWSWDLGTPVMEWTPETYRIYGVSPDTFVPSQEAFLSLIHPDDRASMEAWIGSTAAGEEPPALEFRVILPDGSVRHIHGRGSLVLDAENQPIRMAGIAENITERKQAEVELREERRKREAVLADLFENAPVAYHELDRDGVVRRVNAAECALLGYQADEILGRPVWDFITGVERAASREAVLQKMSGTQSPAPLRRHFVRRDGAEVLVEIHVRLVRGEAGEIQGLRSALFDITETAHAEQLIHRHVIELEAAHQAQEKNAIDLARLVEELGLEKEHAEAATRAKSEFLANMSHEIRTPMNGVIGMTGLLLDTELNQEQRRYGEIVRASGEALLGIINDILDFSKIEAKKLDLETLDFDLQSLLDDFAATLAVPAQEKGLELLCSADPEVPVRLRGDPGRLRQILNNLVGNAIKFTLKGEVAVRVSLESGTGPDVLLRFSVRDTGMGIPEDKIGLLFAKFSQVDVSTTRKYGGTGLGLAISKQLAGLMGGEVGVESQEGQGSEFWFTARLGRQTEGTRTEGGPSADLRGVRVLIVDDNATNREILTKRMGSWGMRTSEVEDGPSALEALHRAREENDPFRVAVIDMQMPGMDGETLGRAIQADQGLAGTRMVMLTSLGVQGDARRLEEIGFAASATKPIRHSELMSILSLALTRRSDTTPPPQPIAAPLAAREMLSLFAGRKTRILLAEDNITNQQVALGMLKKFGLRADAVADGAEALQALETIPYDLVLMDVQMPVMDGLEATRRIRHPQSSVRHHEIPIIAMTAHAMQGDRERCLAAGMNGYVSKPVSPQALAEVLARWLPEKKEEVKMLQARETSPSVPSAVLPVVFDRPGMLERLMHDEDLARVVTDSFLNDIPRQIQALRGYLEACEAPGAERQAHTIKGASAAVGGEALSALAFEMEKSGKAGDLGSVAARMDELELEFVRLKEAMAIET